MWNSGKAFEMGGEFLMDVRIRQAARRGITKIYLEASKDGRGLYEGMGFRDMEDMMGLSADERA